MIEKGPPLHLSYQTFFSWPSLDSLGNRSISCGAGSARAVFFLFSFVFSVYFSFIFWAIALPKGGPPFKEDFLFEFHTLIKTIQCVAFKVSSRIIIRFLQFIVFHSN